MKMDSALPRGRCDAHDLYAAVRRNAGAGRAVSRRGRQSRVSGQRSHIVASLDSSLAFYRDGLGLEAGPDWPPCSGRTKLS